MNHQKIYAASQKDLNKFAATNSSMPESYTIKEVGDKAFPFALEDAEGGQIAKFVSKEDFGKFIRAIAKQARDEERDDAESRD